MNSRDNINNKETGMDVGEIQRLRELLTWGNITIARHYVESLGVPFQSPVVENIFREVLENPYVKPSPKEAIRDYLNRKYENETTGLTRIGNMDILSIRCDEDN